MTLEFTEDTEVECILFISGGFFPDGQGMDWLGCVYKQPRRPWTFRYRFRYYEDGKFFDSDDRKSWYSVTSRDPSEGPAKLIDAAKMIADLTAKQYQGKVWLLEVKGNGVKAAEMLSKAPWAHTKEVHQSN